MGNLLSGIEGLLDKKKQPEPEAQAAGGGNAQANGAAGDAATRRMLKDDEQAVEQSNGLDPKTEQKILAALEKATPDELSLLDDLFHVPGGHEHVADFFSGANTVIPDGGKLYEKWSKLPSAKARISSHRAKGTQYNIPGPATGPILFAESEDGSGTWLQLEGYRGDLSLASAPDIIPHMIDYLKYKLTGKNQSRFGSSAHTDKNPVVLGH